MTGQHFEEATQAREEDGPVHGERERGRGCAVVLHQRLLPVQRHFHPTDALEP